MDSERKLTEEEIVLVAELSVRFPTTETPVIAEVVRAARRTEMAEGLLRVIADLRYIDGIVTRGTGEESKPEESAKMRILAYVKGLEAKLAALSYAEQKREGESRAALKILASYYEAMSRILPNVAQLLDGWHQDGTAWTEWDESVRKDVSLLLEMVEVLRKRIEEVAP